MIGCNDLFFGIIKFFFNISFISIIDQYVDLLWCQRLLYFIYKYF
jgi:hypothetical protein